MGQKRPGVKARVANAWVVKTWGLEMKHEVLKWVKAWGSLHPLSHLYVHNDCKTEGLKPGSWPMLTQGLPSRFLAPLTHHVPASPREDSNPQWTQVSLPRTLRPPCPRGAEMVLALGASCHCDLCPCEPQQL